MRMIMLMEGPSWRGAARRVAVGLARTRPVAVAAHLVRRIDSAVANVLTVLTYHRVARAGERTDLFPGMISATPEAFECQIRTVLRGGAFVSLDDVLSARHGAPLPAGAVLLTFDDAYADFVRHAWPVLERMGVPAVVFVPTGYPDEPGASFWWDRLYHALSSTPRDRAHLASGEEIPAGSPEAALHALRVLRGRIKAMPHDGAMAFVDDLVHQLATSEPAPAVLGWEELRGLRDRGVALAAHTRTHPLLTRVLPERATCEITGSFRDLEERTGETRRVFAYPSGDHDRRVVELVARTRVDLAFTTVRGANVAETADWLRLRRVNVGSATTPAVLEAQLSPALARFRRWSDSTRSVSRAASHTP